MSTRDPFTHTWQAPHLIFFRRMFMCWDRAIVKPVVASVTTLACGALLYSLPAASQAAQFMDCNGAPLCGVLTLETGLGRGTYSHVKPTLHGLWPQTGRYGSSQCLRPTRSSAKPSLLFECYLSLDTPRQKQLSFEQHEWVKHGQCAGARDAEDYFRQACGLSRKPLQLMASERRAGAFDVHAYARSLRRAGYPVFAVDSRNSQVELSACAGDDGVWKLAEPSEFGARCPAAAPGATPRGSDDPSVSDLSRQQCMPSKRGPSCSSDADCSYSGCVRCANSGYCTDQPLPGAKMSAMRDAPSRSASASALQCVRGARGPRCSSSADCGYSGCVRCAKSGYCTDQSLRG